MSTNLNPINNEYQRFKVNGTEERIIKMPESREDTVVITMGGRSEHATELSVESFEDITGHYIVGLEPEYEYDLNELLLAYKDLLREKDFTVEENDSKYSLAGGNIRFATANNVHVTVLSYIAERGDNYTVTVVRDAGYQTKRRQEFTGPKASLPLLLSNAEKTIEAYTSTKVQILSKDITEEENVRKYDDNGFAILKPNESVNDYFNNQEMDAGVVINAAGKFQAFYSYKIGEDINDIQLTDPNFKHGDHAFRTFHYETKDYKTIKGAEKFLKSKGYDLQGKSLDNVDVNEFAEAFRNYNSRSFHSDMTNSWDDNVISYFHMPNGHGTIQHLQKEVDEKFGVKLAMVIDYTDEKTGKSYQEKSYIENTADSFDYGGATAKLTKFTKNVYENLYSESSPEIEFEEDLRTNAEKAQYHKERAMTHIRSVEHNKKYMEEAEIPYKTALDKLESAQKQLQDANGDSSATEELKREVQSAENQVKHSGNRYHGWKKSFDKYEALVSHHKEAYKELSQEIESGMNL
jgi:hypothetical protein